MWSPAGSRWNRKYWKVWEHSPVSAWAAPHTASAQQRTAEQDCRGEMHWFRTSKPAFPWGAAVFAHLPTPRVARELRPVGVGDRLVDADRAVASGVALHHDGLVRRAVQRVGHVRRCPDHPAVVLAAGATALPAEDLSGGAQTGADRPAEPIGLQCATRTVSANCSWEQVTRQRVALGSAFKKIEL